MTGNYVKLLKEILWAVKFDKTSYSFLGDVIKKIVSDHTPWRVIDVIDQRLGNYVSSLSADNDDFSVSNNVAFNLDV
jgi:hypothetical protein